MSLIEKPHQSEGSNAGGDARISAEHLVGCDRSGRNRGWYVRRRPVIGGRSWPAWHRDDSKISAVCRGEVRVGQPHQDLGRSPGCGFG